MATLVLSVALAIAALVLADLQKWSESARARLIRPDTALVLLHLRRDLRSARALPVGTAVGTAVGAAPGALVLLGATDQGLGRVVYARRDAILERTAFDRAGELTDRATVLAGVSSFRSALVADGLVDVEILLRPTGRGADRGQSAVRLRVALRNRPRSRW